MACTITILSPTGQETIDGQGITTLTVTGTATCTTVRVQIHQTHPVTIATPAKTAPVTNGQWSVDFTIDEGDFQSGDFRCGHDNKYVINAECIDDRNCQDQLAGSLINCDRCPEVTITVTPGACINGRRTVHFKAHVISAHDAFYTWFFGADDDNQPGEDHQSGDGNGNLWLPAPDTDGVRVIETNHTYEPANDQSQEIIVKLVTSNGPASLCTASQTFTLEPCECDLTVSLQVLNQAGNPVSTSDCLPPGDYIVEITSPTGSNTDYSWSVNGTADNSQNGPAFNFQITSGEEKTISVFVEQGGCDGSNAVTAKGCADCSDFDAQLRILDSNRRDVSHESCLPEGPYTVQATSPTGPGNAFKWSLDNVVDASATGTTLHVNLEDGDTRIVTLEASRGSCRDTTSIVLATCGAVNDVPREEFIPCLLYKILALLGLGLLILGAILLLCPTISMPLLPPQAAASIGIALLTGGTALLFLGLLLWFLICQPTRCDWLAFFWQALVLLGLLMIYAGFCPTCSWMLLGSNALIVGIGLAILWQRNCNITRCHALREWISLFTFVVTVIAVLEMILAACAIISNPVASIIWGLAIAGVQAWLWFEANRNNCFRD